MNEGTNTTTKYNLSLVLNTLGLLSNLSCLYVVHYWYANPFAQGFGGQFQYLTVIGLTWSSIAFCINIYRYIHPHSLKGLHDLFVHVAMPLETNISLFYWSMTFMGPHMLSPKEVEVVPWMVDCAMHLYPTIVLWVDFLLTNSHFKRAWIHIAYIYSLAVVYYGWSCYCQHRNGYWVYQFLDRFDSHWSRFGFYFASGTISWLCYELGAFIYSRTRTLIHAKKLS
ncbi:FAR-17a/AIG1-like protein [Chlamydoabsidia padenii]|nr:FAR-17a/AIG1-like protein [Chlamydoabsidia padenii]